MLFWQFRVAWIAWTQLRGAGHSYTWRRTQTGSNSHHSTNFFTSFCWSERFSFLVINICSNEFFQRSKCSFYLERSLLQRNTENRLIKERGWVRHSEACAKLYKLWHWSETWLKDQTEGRHHTQGATVPWGYFALRWFQGSTSSGPGPRPGLLLGAKVSLVFEPLLKTSSLDTSFTLCLSVNLCQRRCLHDGCVCGEGGDIVRVYVCVRMCVLVCVYVYIRVCVKRDTDGH